MGAAYDWESNTRPASFDDFRRRYRALPGDQLARVTSAYLEQGAVGAQGSGPTGEDDAPTATVVSAGDGAAGPAGVRSLLSRVEPSGVSREEHMVRLGTRFPSPRVFSFLCDYNDEGWAYVRGVVVH